MQAIQIEKYVKRPSELTVSSVSIAQRTSSRQALVKVNSVGLNFFDALQIQGKYQTQPPLPFNAGAEFSGTIVEVHDERGIPGLKFNKGDRVFGQGQGAFAEYVVCDLDNLLPVPERINFVQAAGLFVTAPTSYVALVKIGKLQKDEICLVHAAAGGVGLMAVQIAKSLGAAVIGTASTPEKLQVAKKYGADYLVNYTDSDWLDQVNKVSAEYKKERNARLGVKHKGIVGTTGGVAGVDVIFDPVGLVEKSTKVVAWNGRILVVGFAGGTIEKLAMNRVLLKQCSIMGVFWGAHAIHDRQTMTETWARLLALFQKQILLPTPYTRVREGLGSIPDALESLSSRETWGKVIVKVDSSKSKL